MAYAFFVIVHRSKLLLSTRSPCSCFWIMLRLVVAFGSCCRFVVPPSNVSSCAEKFLTNSCSGHATCLLVIWLARHAYVGNFFLMEYMVVGNSKCTSAICTYTFLKDRS